MGVAREDETAQSERGRELGGFEFGLKGRLP